jgi:membrane-bound serine protease (ClpP class)
MNSYAIFAILLLFAGLAVLVAEVFLPSGGLLFCITAVALITSVSFAYAAWWQSNPAAFWTFCAFLLMMIPAVVIVAFSWLPRTRFGKKILLEAPEPEQLTPYAEQSVRLSQLVGKSGVTNTLLNPGGMVTVEGERHHAFTDGLLLDPGVPIEVVDVRGTRLLVRPPSNKMAAPGDAGDDEAPPLDFDIPEET